MNLSRYAGHRGVTVGYISRLVREGKLTVDEHGELDAETADMEMDNNRPSGKHRGPIATNPDGITLAELNRQEKALKVAMLQMDHDVKSRLLLSSDDVRESVFTLARRTRDMLLSIPDRLAPLLVGITDASDVNRIMAEEIRMVCQEIASFEPVS